jgi:prepilin-type N-terminal cleavage/methylation domain-containing protein
MSKLSHTCRLRPASRAFTLIEMLVSIAVFAMMATAMLALVEEATRLWRDNEARIDACREARAALVVMAHDLRNAVAASNHEFIKFNLQSGAAGTNHGSNVFFLASLPPSAQEAGSRSDVCQVGYFLAFDRSSASANRTLNLYRYFRSSNRTFPNLIAATLFTDIATDAAGEELLARNVVGMKITPVGANGGHWASFDPSSNSGLPAMIEITLSTIGQDTANRLEEADWTATNSGLMTRAVQTLTTRISFPQQQ